ncbi:MAG: serine/threonine-protein phosphatase [Deltaproteobacteria bacterium]|nr:serine/threonine-protein phosphatase [Deltaproteobacteria bacterium]
METYAITHRGLKRKENQDRFFIREWDDQTILVAVADGMGGEAGGGLAAQISIEAVKEFTPDPAAPEAFLKKAFQTAALRIHEEVRKDFRLDGMGTTLTGACIKNGMTFWAHVGDSRLYLFREGDLTQITEDHTFVNSLVKDGVITREEAERHPMQNILLHCVGCEPMEVSSGRFEVFKGDLILLSTDGLHHEVLEKKISSILAGETGIKEKFERLLKAALEAGGRDNITLAGVRV